MDNNFIYLDNAATTKPYTEVLEAYNKAATLYFANASSVHFEGNKSARLLSQAREQILKLLGCENSYDFIFTSGATEANNLGIKGYVVSHLNRGKHIITTTIEHPSVLETVKYLEKFYGCEITYLSVDENGFISLEELKKAIRSDTILISIMAVNNETGTIGPIKEVINIVKKFPKIVLHVDATQAISKIQLPYNQIDMISFSGHKIHGLKYSGGLLLNKKIQLEALISGGGQENNLRSGTNDVALAVSLAKALRISLQNMEKDEKHIQKLREELIQYLISKPEKYVLNSPINGSNNIVNFSLLDKKASVVVEALSNNNIMVSSISACHSRSEPNSYVIYEMTKDFNRSKNTIRVSFDGENTIDEVKILIKKLDLICNEVKYNG